MVLEKPGTGRPGNLRETRSDRPKNSVTGDDENRYPARTKRLPFGPTEPLDKVHRPSSEGTYFLPASGLISTETARSVNVVGGADCADQRPGSGGSDVELLAQCLCRDGALVLLPMEGIFPART